MKLFMYRRQYDIVHGILCSEIQKSLTLPGLYLITIAISLFNITFIRCINLFKMCLNLYLIYNIIKENCKSNETEWWNKWLILRLAYNITLGAFFIIHDISVNIVLVMLFLHQHKHKNDSICSYVDEKKTETAIDTELSIDTIYVSKLRYAYRLCFPIRAGNTISKRSVYVTYITNANGSSLSFARLHRRMSNSVIRYSLADVAKCNGTNGSRTWIVIYDNVYDVTDYMAQHPGGPELIEEYAGKDATDGFDDFGHSSDAKKILKEYLIGELKDEDKKVNRKKKHIVANGIKIERTDKRRTFLAILCGKCTS